MNSKLSHLSKEEIELLIKRYYNGEKTRTLIDEFKIDTKTTSLNKLFPPFTSETLCPYCDNVNLVSMYESRNNSNMRSKPFCPDCKHVPDSYCQCDNCKQHKHFLRSEIADRKRLLIKETCSSIFISPYTVRDLSFETAVYLMALTRHLVSEDLKFAFPFDKNHTKLAPTFEFTNKMKGSLNNHGIINISSESKSDTFTYNEDITEIITYYPSEVQWEFLSPFSIQEKKAYISELEKIIASDSWPEHWRNESNKLWHAISLHECLEYLIYLLESRHFSITEIGEKTIATLETMLRSFSVAQIFNLSWQSIKDTVDFLKQRGIPHTQAPNVLTSTLLRKGDRALAQGWIVNDSRRDFNCAQSVVSSTLFNLFLKLGDAALTTRVPKLNDIDIDW
jgi:hypothetical protein